MRFIILVAVLFIFGCAGEEKKKCDHEEGATERLFYSRCSK